MDTSFKYTLDGDGCNGFPSGAHYLLDDPVVLAFQAQGGVIEPARTPEEIQAQTLADLTAAIQTHLDAVARTRNYDGILSLCSYAVSPHPKFGHEGLAGLAWRDSVWDAGYRILADVQSGARPAPTAEELILELPTIVW